MAAALPAAHYQAVQAALTLDTAATPVTVTANCGPQNPHVGCDGSLDLSGIPSRVVVTLTITNPGVTFVAPAGPGSCLLFADLPGAAPASKHAVHPGGAGEHQFRTAFACRAGARSVTFEYFNDSTVSPRSQYGFYFHAPTRMTAVDPSIINGGNNQ